MFNYISFHLSKAKERKHRTRGLLMFFFSYINTHINAYFSDIIKKQNLSIGNYMAVRKDATAARFV